MQNIAKSKLTITTYFSFAKFLLVCLALIVPSKAYSHELSRCGRALQLALQGSFLETEKIRAQSCPVTSSLIQWLQLQNPIERTGMSFSKIISFLRNHADWPLKERLQIYAEESLKETDNRNELRKWFDENPPLTAKGATFYARALIKVGRNNAAKSIIQYAWVKFDFETNALKSFWQEFKDHLNQENHYQRVDRLLMKEKTSAARIMFPWLNQGQKALTDARITLIEKGGDVDTKLGKIPMELSSDPGLVYDRIKWHRRKENNTHMMALLETATSPVEDEELWWRERNLLIRRMMDDRRYQDAYNLAKNHGLSVGEDFANGEWLAGWIALRMLKKPEVALSHFQTLYDKVKTPISIARAAYWSSRAASALRKPQESQNWMTKAKSYPGTYYGQLALRGSVTGAAPQLHPKRRPIDAHTRQKFEDRPLVRAVRLLCAVGGKHLVEPFGIKLSQELTDPGEQILLIEMAAAECGPYYGVLASKKLPMKNVPLIEAAYPILPRHFQKETSKTNSALVHAIIRQEKSFKADALSPAGAQGLMQLMPKTALQTARRSKNNLGSLSDPNVNLPLGCAHLNNLLDRFKGSLILSIAAYNAGAKAVESWIEKYGDPRHQGVDLIDWIETIPYAETRNYVQRVWENYAYYAQRLSK